MKLIKENILIPVDVKDEMPKNNTEFYTDKGKSLFMYDRYWRTGDFNELHGVETWLKEKNNAYVLSEYELLDLIKNAYQAGWQDGNADGYKTGIEIYDNIELDKGCTFDDYLQSLNILSGRIGTPYKK